MSKHIGPRGLIVWQQSGHWQVRLQVSPLGQGEPGGSQSSPGSTIPFPQRSGGHWQLGWQSWPSGQGEPGGSHCSPGPTNASPQDDGGRLVEVVEELLVDVLELEELLVDVLVLEDVLVLDVVLVDVVEVVAQPPSTHASQQLGKFPTHALPPFGAIHAVALLLMEQDVLPLLVVRQHVT